MRGRDRGEGQAAQWVADSIWKGREEKARLEAGTCHGHHPRGMPVRAPAALGEQWGLGWPRTCYLSLGFSR